MESLRKSNCFCGIRTVTNQSLNVSRFNSQRSGRKENRGKKKHVRCRETKEKLYWKIQRETLEHQSRELKYRQRRTYRRNRAAQVMQRKTDHNTNLTSFSQNTPHTPWRLSHTLNINSFLGSHDHHSVIDRCGRVYWVTWPSLCDWQLWAGLLHV